MRGIGKGQTVTMLLTPEVKAIVERTLNPADDGEPEEAKPQRRVLCDIATWLFVNSVKSEKVQQDMLAMQCIKNVWRKPAYRTLLATGGTGKGTAPALNAWREPIELSVPNTIPGEADFETKIRVRLRHFVKVFTHAEALWIFF